MTLFEKAKKAVTIKNQVLRFEGKRERASLACRIYLVPFIFLLLHAGCKIVREDHEPVILSAAKSSEQLEAAGSVERAYGVNGGNDFVVFFLTDKLYLIVGDPQASLEYGPYTPTLDYPRFGQPIG